MHAGVDRATRFVVASMCALFLAVAHTTSAQEFDYDPARPAALRACDDLRNHGRTPDARACYERLLSSSTDDATQAEAAWAIGDVRRANDLFRAVVQAEDNAVRPKVRWGRLYLDTHQYGEASGLFREALDLAPDDVYAKLAVARLMSETFDGDARRLVAQIIDKGGDKVLEAHLLAARMDLDDGHYGAAERSLQRAIALAVEQKQPPLEAYELLAALDLLRGDRESRRWIDKALAYNPHYGGVYETLAHYEVMRRRYTEANDWLKRAVEVQPERWSAQAELGVNLLRLGDIDGSQAALQRAYSGDPFSATTVNTLRVLDKLKDFAVERATSPDIVMRLDRKEADALRPYVEKVARESITTFSRRYSFTPQQAVNIEMYPNHDDFAVRTAGLPGIGLLGVTFGYLVAMDSPSGRSTGDFHWGSTLWHEMAHVFTLSITDHRVPRWLSEGISVFEEWRTGPTPGIAVSPRALDVFHDGKFLPVATLDEGFIRPDYPDQVQVSYMQSGLTCYFIEQRWGFDKLVALLRQFTKETTTAAAVEATFKMSPSDFDKELAKFLNERFAKYLADPKAWQQAMQAAHQAAGESKWADVIEPARRAVDLFPDYTLSGSPWLLLARAYDETGKRADALGALQRYRELGGWDPDALRKLATWLDEAKQPQKSLEVLNALTLIAPLDASLHAQLGERYNADGKAADSLREYKVLLALDAHDNAAANFGIARALNSLGDRAQSRRYVLQALETAPHYRPAQDLLLEITGKPTQ
ncbi:MAG TPA: tetratricopeptide repeat protein [Steroidobacteraceae bacterium]|nr:tetratricopeptide repeat protein [Steroidobacteraceae bacterium]